MPFACRKLYFGRGVSVDTVPALYRPSNCHISLDSNWHRVTGDMTVKLQYPILRDLLHLDQASECCMLRKRRRPYTILSQFVRC